VHNRPTAASDDAFVPFVYAPGPTTLPNQTQFICNS